MSALELIEALLSATPERPPAPEADPAEVLAAAEVVSLARAPHLKTLGVLLSGGAPPESAKPLLAELSARDARWNAALERAKHLAGERLRAVRALRRGGVTP